MRFKRSTRESNSVLNPLHLDQAFPFNMVGFIPRITRLSFLKGAASYQCFSAEISACNILATAVDKLPFTTTNKGCK